MVAELKNYPSVVPDVARTMFAEFEEEAAAELFLIRLADLGIAVETVTFLRVELHEVPRYYRTLRRDLQRSPLFFRNTVIGGLCGGFIAMGLGVLLNRSDLLNLTFIETIFIYFVALCGLGIILGGTLGAVLASYQSPVLATPLPYAHADKYLVSVKVPPTLVTNFKSLAQSFGASKISD